jgi:hypothetical protein
MRRGEEASAMTPARKKSRENVFFITFSFFAILV